MKPAELRKQIASGDTKPIYLVEGGDRQSRHDVALEFAALVGEGLQAFNVQPFHANGATSGSARDQLIADLLSTARTLPMMAPRRVLIVHDAEFLLSPRKAKDEEIEPPAVPAPGSKKKRSLTPIDELEEYFAKPEPLTTLVFVAGPLDANRRLVKLVRKHAAAVDCSLGSVETARWIQERLEKERLKIDPRATALLLDIIGANVDRLRMEVEKLALYAAGESAVTVQHVKDLVTTEVEPGEDFALGKAIWRGNAREALREIAAQFEAGAQGPMVLGQIRAAAGRLQPDDRARSGLDAVFEADLAMKSSGGEPRYLLERLVIELCAPGSAR